MTTFPTSPLPLAAPVTSAGAAFDSREKVESLVKRTRKKQVPAEVEQRAVPRSSIAELEATDHDTIRERMQSSRLDDRGPVVKFLDLVDSGRNQILATLAPGLERRAREKGEVAAFGTGRVNFSDVLGEMGMSPGFTRSVLGFVGDVAFDPLTYAGGVGIGAKVATKGGRAVNIGRGGVRALKKAEKVGGSAVPEVQALIDATGSAQNLRKSVLGTPDAAVGLRAKAGRTFSETLKGKPAGQSGLIHDYADAYTLADDASRAIADGKMKAVDDFIQKYGHGAGPAAVKIGRDKAGKLRFQVGAGRGNDAVNATQSLFHIPFTDVSLLSVPAFGPVSRASAVGLRRAAEGATRQGVVAAASPKTREVAQIVDQFEGLVKKRGERWSSELKLRQENPDAIARLYPNGIETDDIFEASLLDSTNPDAAIHASIRANRVANKADDEALGQLRDRLQARLAEVDQAPQAFSVGEILALQDQVRRLDAVAGAHLSKIGANAEHIQLRNSLLASEAERLNSVMSVTTRLSALDEAMAEGGKGSPFSVRPFLGFDPATASTVVNADPEVVGQVSARIGQIKRPSGMTLLEEYEDAVDDLVKAERGGEATIAQSAEGLDKAALRARAESLRNELHAATAPLREGAAMSTIEDFTEAVRARDRAALRRSNEIMADLIEMPEPEARAFDDMTRVASEGVATALAASLATKASAIAFMSPEQIRLLELNKDFLGTADSIVGASTMSGLQTIAQNLFRPNSEAALSIRNRLDQAMANTSASYRRYLGGPRGELADAVRHAVYMTGDGGRRAAAERMAGMFKDMRSLAAKHGMGGKEDELLSLATALHIEQNLRGADVFRMKDVDGNVTGFARHLEQAAKRGLITPGRDSPLEQELLAFTRKHDLITPIREIEAAEGVLGLASNRGGRYFPNTPTATGQKFIDRAKGASLEPSAGVQKAIGKGQEDFQKPRSLDSAIFDSTVLGRKVEVFEGDRWVQTMSDQEIAQIVDPQRRKFVEDTKAALDEYDRMPARPPMAQNDPFRVNELKERLRALWGADDIPGGFMDTNYATALGARYYAHERALATKLFEREVLPAATLPVGVQELRELANVPHGTEVRLKNGMVAKLVQLGSGAAGPDSRVYSGPAIKVGDDIFRPLAPGVRNVGNNPMIDALGDTGKGAIYHQHVAEIIESASKLFTDDGYAFWKNIDKLTGHWKRITLLHPSWWMSNVIGESINYSAQDPGFPAALGKYGKVVAQMFRVARDPEALAKIKFGVMGSETTGLAEMGRVRDTPIVGSAMFQEASSRSMRNDTIMHSRLGGPKQAMGKAAIAGDYEQMIAKNIATGDGPILSAIKSGAAVAGDRVNRFLFEPWTRANATTSDMLRTVAYLSLRDQGWSQGEAIRRVVRAGFDYQDLTPWEREWGRRLFPFWAWLKNNSIYQAKMLMERPMFVGGLPVLQHAIEEAINGEGVIPISERPKWMQEGMALQIGSEDRGRVGLIVGNFLPQEQALLFGRFASGAEGVQSAANYITSSLNPAIRAPLELGAGREFFSDRTIGGDATMNDLSIGGHIANQIRPLREIPKLASTITDQGVVAGGLRAALGGRVQPMTDDRIRTSNERDFRDKEERLRIAIRRADRQGNTSARAEANLKLMLLYKAMLERGLQESVPKWARERLAGMMPQEAAV